MKTNRRNFIKGVTGFVAGICTAFVPSVKAKHILTQKEFQDALNDVCNEALEKIGRKRVPKFRTGDRVRISDTLPLNMSHFRGAGGNATVLYSNITQDGFGVEGDKRIIYCLDIDDFGHSAWWPEYLLTKYGSHKRTN